MATMRAAQIARPGGDFELVEREIPEPGRRQVRVRVEACGICHSDAFVKEGAFPGIEYPRIPGHEVAGVVDAAGEDVKEVAVGDRVGVGWHGGHCFHCDACRRGDFTTCHNARITGIAFDGGYAEYMLAPEEGLARIPPTLGSVEAAPLLCAGITTYNALRNADLRPGERIAVQGVGGLGHLAIQYAREMGLQVVALSRGPNKREQAMELGASEYVDTAATDPAEAIGGDRGVRAAIATAPSSAAISQLIDTLDVNGRLIIVGVDAEPITVSPLQLIPRRRRILGWPSGTAKDSEDTLDFSALRGIRAAIETYPLEQVAEAYQRMIDNQARFRVVLSMR